MTGLEKMKSQILDEAKAAAESKVSEARAQAAKIVCEAKDEAEKAGRAFSRSRRLRSRGIRNGSLLPLICREGQRSLRRSRS